MVVFTCNHCGESLHKPKVEKHYQGACRNNAVFVTCVDCFKDFKGDEFVGHTKCKTEDERYSAKGTFVNGDVKKGEVKQESWVEMIKSILDNDLNLSGGQRRLLETVSSYNNVPRKKPKFLNFIKSSSGGRTNLKEAEDVWNIIEKYKNMQQSKTQNGAENGNSKNAENGNIENCEEFPQKKKKKSRTENEDIETEKQNKNGINEKKKRKMPESNEEKPQKKKKKQQEESLENAQDNNKDVTIADNENSVASEKFDFKEKILEIINAKKNISLKKLQKKVFNAYMKSTGEAECSEKVIKKYNKKLKKINNLQIDESTVTLIET